MTPISFHIGGGGSNGGVWGVEGERRGNQRHPAATATTHRIPGTGGGGGGTRPSPATATAIPYWAPEGGGVGRGNETTTNSYNPILGAGWGVETTATTHPILYIGGWGGGGEGGANDTIHS